MKTVTRYFPVSGTQLEVYKKLSHIKSAVKNLPALEARQSIAIQNGGVWYGIVWVEKQSRSRKVRWSTIKAVAENVVGHSLELIPSEPL